MSLDNILLIPGLGGLNLQRVLFGAGEVGGIWDWSDRSTMFQDVAGTQPITASGQTVGLHLDKSKGLVLRPELVTNGTFDSNIDGWSSSFVTLPEFVWADGKAKITNASTNVGLKSPPLSIDPTKSYLISYDLEITSGSVIQVRFGGELSSSNVPNGGMSISGTKQIVSHPLGPGPWNTILFQVSTGSTLSIDNVSVRELPGNHRYQASAASRAQYIEDETGHYGLYDGVDDFYETNAVDFTGTDKMTVWWGGRKLSDAIGQGTLVELSSTSTTTNATFALFGPSSTSQPNYQFRSRGTTLATAITPNSFAAPISNVLTMSSDISLPLVRGRVNGSQEAEQLSSQGTGNYGNHKLYFGRRAGTSFPANIREYMTIIRGAQTSTSLIEQVERAVRGKIKGLTW